MERSCMLKQCSLHWSTCPCNVLDLEKVTSRHSHWVHQPRRNPLKSLHKRIQESNWGTHLVMLNGPLCLHTPNDLYPAASSFCVSKHNLHAQCPYKVKLITHIYTFKAFEGRTDGTGTWKLVWSISVTINACSVLIPLSGEVIVAKLLFSLNMLDSGEWLSSETFKTSPKYLLEPMAPVVGVRSTFFDLCSPCRSPNFCECSCLLTTRHKA